jgi:hypothetical protein
MISLLHKQDLSSKFLHAILLKSHSLSKFLNKLLTGLVVIIMLFISLFAIIGMASHTQKLEADVGLRHKNVSVAQVGLIYKIQNAILNPVKTSAFSLNPLDGLGEILGGAMKAVAEPIFNIILKLLDGIVSKILGQILKPLLSVINKILDVITGVLDMVENLATNLAGTRVGIGFKVYKDIEGANSAGSSNFESSSNFVKRLLDVAGYSTNTQTIFNSNFPKKNEVQNLLADTIAWGDFMSVQKAMQSNVVGDFVAATLKTTNIANFDQINENVTNIIMGKKCESSNIIFSVTPVFKSFGSIASSCVAENRGIITQQLVARQQQILATTVAKSLQYETKLPPDCRYGQYFEVPSSANLEYNPEDSQDQGNLGSRIATFATAISLKTITGEECQNIKTGKQNQIKALSDIFSPSNILAGVGAGLPISEILGASISSLGTALFSSISSKFEGASKIIESVGSQISSGVGMYGALAKVVSFKSAINQKLESLNQEYEQYRGGQYQSLNNSETTLNEINQST